MVNYLSPEPLLQNPLYVRRMAQGGMSVPTYAYAANNPLRYTDSTGREIEIRGGAAAQITAGWALGEMLANPVIGNATALAMMDPLNKIAINVRDGLGLEQFGGGRTSCPRTSHQWPTAPFWGPAR